MAVTVEEQVVIDLTVEMKNLTSSLNRAKSQTKTATKRMSRDFDNVRQSIRRTQSEVATLTATIVGEYAIRSVKALAEVADGWNLVEGRIKLVSASSEDLEQSQQALFAIAQESRVEYETIADLYARIARNTKQMNIEDSTRLEVTEAIGKSLIISGASAESANAALVQLGQGLAAGALRGQELNSVMEQTPRISEAIATGLGLTIGQLRKYAEQGKLTAEAVVQALSGQLDKISREFAEMPKTIGQASTVMSNAFQKLVGDFDDAAGASEYFTENMIGLATYMSTNSEALIQTGLAITHTISRMVDQFLVLYQSANLGFMTLVAAFESGWQNITNTFDLRIAQIQAKFYELQIDAAEAGKSVTEAFGGKESSSDLNIRITAINNMHKALIEVEAVTRRMASKKGVLDNEELKHEARILEELAQNANVTISERIALSKKESEEMAKRNQFRREAETFSKKALQDEKERIRMLKTRLRLNTQQVGDGTAIEGSGSDRLAGVLSQYAELKKRIEAAGAAGDINAAEQERYLYDLEKALERAYSHGEAEATEAHKKAMAGYKDEIDMIKSKIKLEKEESKTSFNYENNEENFKSLMALYDEMHDKRMINEEEYLKYSNEVNKARLEQSTQMQAVQEVLTSQLEAGFTRAIRSMMDGVTSFGDMFKSLLKDITAELIRVLVIKKMVAGIVGMFADGGVFSGGSQVTAYAQGGVVDSPTIFPMANGGVGLMGEAGPEAIMPLTRDSSGRLGVRAEGAGGGGGVSMNVTIINNGNDDVKTSQDEGGNLLVIIEQVTSSIANGITRGTSPVGQAIQSTYGIGA